MTGIPTSSFYRLGQFLLEQAINDSLIENLYDSSESFMKPGSDYLNDSSFYEYSSDSSLDLSSDSENWFFTICVISELQCDKCQHLPVN